MWQSLLGSVVSNPSFFNNINPTSPTYTSDKGLSGLSISGLKDWGVKNTTGNILGGGTTKSAPSSGTSGVLPTSEGSGSSWMPLLSSALQAGLSSLGTPSPMGGGSSAGPSTVVQSQNVSQSSPVSVTNILGREFAGGVSQTGDFDVFTAISDVFKIRDAQIAANTPQVTGGVPLSFQSSSGMNWTPILIIGGGIALLALLMKKGK